MSERNEAAPHECPECGEPAYLGFGMPGKCVARACVFYDVALWCEWVMLIPDDGMPRNDEPDFFDLEEEDTNPGFGTPLVWSSQPSAKTWGNYLDTYGSVLGKTRKDGESDEDFYDRLLGAWGARP